jgi:hypothetical protein
VFAAEVTDEQFLELVFDVLGNVAMTVINMINTWKPLGRKATKLVEYGYMVFVMDLGPSSKKNALSKKNVDWRPGASTLEGESSQRFGNAKWFPNDPSISVTLNHMLKVTATLPAKVTQ